MWDSISIEISMVNAFNMDNTFLGKDKNHHFISQAEQRLNTCTPFAASKNQKIYKAKITQNNEGFSLQPQAQAKVSIKNNLAQHNLYTLGVINKEEQFNFEKIFQRYENTFINDANMLINMVKNDEIPPNDLIIRLYTFKVLSFIRNPNNIKQVLTLWKPHIIHNINDELYLLALYQIHTGNKPQIKQLCQEFYVSEQEYKDWLTILLMLSLNTKSKNSKIQDIISTYFDTNEIYSHACIYYLDEPAVLLPDTNFITIESNNGHGHLMNITSHCYIYIHHELLESIEGLSIDVNDGLIMENTALHGINEINKNQFIESLRKHLGVTVFWNHYEFLAAYNKLCLDQCNEFVFSAISPDDIMKFILQP